MGRLAVLRGCVKYSSQSYEIKISIIWRWDIFIPSSGKIDERGQYIYFGCLEGRGFDEIGEKGFVVIDTNEKISFKFVPNCSRVFEEVTVDISGTQDIFTAYQKVLSFIKCKPSDIVRINLTGEVSYDTEGLDKEIGKHGRTSIILCP